MIALERIRTAEAIHSNFRGLKRIAWNKELLNTQREIILNSSTEHHFISSRWKVVKEQLFAETNNKCAYCDASTKVVAPGDVEHFRPKSKYWWLAYSYENYLVSCTVCNSAFKGNKFPILDETKPLPAPGIIENSTSAEISLLAKVLNPDPLDNSGMSLIDFTSAFRAERPLLLNPYFDNPSKYFAWEADDILQQVFLIPLKRKHKPFVIAAEENYGLNRKELKELRYREYFLYNTFRETLNDDRISLQTRTRTENAIILMKDKTSPFAGMIRYFDWKYRGI
jgi:hypothetical protein